MDRTQEGRVRLSARSIGLFVDGQSIGNLGSDHESLYWQYRGVGLPRFTSSTRQASQKVDFIVYAEIHRNSLPPSRELEAFRADTVAIICRFLYDVR